MNRYKLGYAVEETITYAATVALTIVESVTVVKVAMTGALGLSIDTDNSQLTPGQRIILKAGSDGTARDVTFGTGFTAPVLSGTISKTKVQEFVYDGATFIPTGALIQIN